MGIGIGIGLALRQLGGAGGLTFSDDFNRADGAIGNGWTGATWTISGNKAVNTPTLGAALIVNGGFGADTDWTKGTGWTIAAGVASHAGGSAGNLTQAVATIGGWYRLVWTLLNRTAGTFTGNPGKQSSLGQTVNATYTESARASSTTAGIATNSTAAGDVDNLSLKQLTISTLFASRDFGRNDVDASVELTIVANNLCGLVLNLDSVVTPANFVYAEHNGTNARLTKVVAGIYTELINAAAAYSAGAAIRVTKLGTTYALYYNGAQVGANQTISDAGIISNNLHGMMNTYELNSLDDFSIMT